MNPFLHPPPSFQLRRVFSRAVLDHHMLVEKDHVLVGLSGGKDSWALLGLLVHLCKRAPISFQISAATIDATGNNQHEKVLKDVCAQLNVPFYCKSQDIFKTVEEKREKGTVFCSMCAKLRRGALYRVAREVGATKLALGHHLDDALETLFLNLFYAGKAAALPPVLLSNAGQVPMIRPLLYCSEPQITRYVTQARFPLIDDDCPMASGTSAQDLKRRKVRRWLRDLREKIPSFYISARSGLSNLNPERFADPQYAQKPDRPKDLFSQAGILCDRLD